MRLSEASKGFVKVLTLLALAVTAAACQEAPVANTNTNTANVNTTAPATNTNTAPVADTGPAIETREPEQYRATMVFTAETSENKQSLAVPIEVARKGSDRRYAINNVPVVGQVIFLDRADKRYLILPDRKQYAELTPETTGFDVRSMTPGQMVAQLQKQRGVERVGEEQLNGRAVIKYRYAGTARTGTQAGEVATESFIYVDKETGLPLRVEGFGQASGNVQGVKSGRVVAEMRDLKTDVEPSLFEVPQGYSQITREQIQQQLSALAAIFQALMSTINAQQGGGATSAATSPSPAAASPSPAAR